MKAAKALGAIPALVGLLACASLPPPAAESPGSAGIAISITNFAPIEIFWRTPDRVFFMRLDEEDESGFTGGELLPSNYAKDGYVYLLNAEPGRYVAVASTRAQSAPPGGSAMHPVASSGHTTVSAGVSIGPTDYTVYFPEDLIRLSDVSVESGMIAYMGTFRINTSVGLGDADETQRYFYRMLAPGHEGKSIVGHIFSGDYQYHGSLREALQGENEQAKFRKRARKTLPAVGWGRALR